MRCTLEVTLQGGSFPSSLALGSLLHQGLPMERRRSESGSNRHVEPAMQVVGFHVEGQSPSPSPTSILQDSLRKISAGSPTPVIIPPSFQVPVYEPVQQLSCLALMVSVNAHTHCLSRHLPMPRRGSPHQQRSPHLLQVELWCVNCMPSCTAKQQPSADHVL